MLRYQIAGVELYRSSPRKQNQENLKNNETELVQQESVFSTNYIYMLVYEAASQQMNKSVSVNHKEKEDKCWYFTFSPFF